MPRLSTLLRSVTLLTAGWMCSVMKPWSLMLGVTSSEMPLKNGVTPMVGVVEGFRWALLGTISFLNAVKWFRRWLISPLSLACTPLGFCQFQLFWF